MKIEIQQTDNNPANTLLDIYTDGLRPICKIYEEDLVEIFSDSQFIKYSNGETKFNLNKNLLFDKCKYWFN